MSPETLTFGPLQVAFDDAVLRPRPWTLLQSSWAAELAADLPPGSILELCAGAGHIGQAAVLSRCALVQVDADPGACRWARLNAEANVSTPVDVRCGDLDDVVQVGERFAVVLADPPYLPRDEVDDHDDPTHAVDGDPDGLELSRRCVAVAGADVADGGAVLLQARGRGQVESLAGALAAAALELVEVRSHDDDRAVALLRPVRRS